MTRKRFVKLQMSQGRSRNSAQLLALICQQKKIPYVRASDVWCCGDPWQMASEAISQWGAFLRKVSTAVAEATAAFGSTFSKCMEADPHA